MAGLKTTPSYSVYGYKLPLAEPFGGTREGMLVAAQREGGGMVWGEVAPLPGFSRETLDEAKAELLSVCAGQSDAPGTLPSVRCGLEQVELGLYNNVSRLYPRRNTIEMTALLSGDHSRILEKARAYRAAGFQSLKLKVGRRDIDSEIALVRAIRASIGPRIRLRCDANRAWSLADAVSFAHGTRGAGIQYIEEPLINPGGLEELAVKFNVPVALDESLTSQEPAWLRGRYYVRFIVLKPMILGGMSRTLAWAQEADCLGLGCAVSSAYETGVGMTGLVEITAYLPWLVAAGLGTYEHLSSDVIIPRLKLDKAFVKVSSAMPTAWRIDASALTPLQCP